MVRWWFRALGGTPDEEKAAFGGMKRFGRRLGDEVVASHLVFRVSRVTATKASPDPATLPHKQGRQASPQAAFAPGGTFHLEVLSRLRSLDDALTAKVRNALEIWTLLGAIGLRANRAGGSIWPLGDNAPRSASELRARLTQLQCSWPVRLADEKLGDQLAALRAAATDTISEPRWVFGAARDGRLASPLKLKLVRLDGRLRLLITAAEERFITEAQRGLKQAGKALGSVAWHSL
jgi:hypothetical protein